jgi:choice-of-anchor A domain-containing protein
LAIELLPKCIMSRISKALLLTSLAVVSLVPLAHADSFGPFGVASAYNLVALGTVDSLGATLIKGTIFTQSDVTGRVAAADSISGNLVVGSSLNSDPWGSSATFGLVAGNGLGSGAHVTMNGGGNAFAPGASSSSFNFNDGGHLVTLGSPGIDFNALRTSLDALSLQLATLNGTAPLGTNQSGFSNSGGHYNPSWFVLKGTDPVLNVFNITAARFASVNNPIDIEAPAGSTIIVNVIGTTPSLGTAIYYNGIQHSGDNESDNKILFNFSTATTVTLNSGFSGSVLSPFAILSGTGQIDGNFIAAAINGTGEVHNVQFTGTLPGDPGSPVPEPGTLVLMGTGMMSLAAAVRRMRSMQ